jgi:hypothetical protein
VTEDERERELRRRAMVRYRARNPQAVLRDKIQTRSRYRAMARLAKIYPEVYEALQQEEEAKAWREEARRA